MNMNIIDFHSHILPYADHGSYSEETSLKQLKFAVKAGVDIVVATPHFYPPEHNVKSFVAKQEICYNKLINVRDKNGVDIKVLKGAEVLICQGLENLPDLNMLCIENTNTLLLELPLYEFRTSYAETAGAIIEAGYNVVLAHADRYEPADVEMMIASGVKIQLNADSFSTLFVKKHIIDWINRGLVVALGSDIHMSDGSAYKKFAKAIKKLSSKAKGIMNETQKIVNK